jgi:apolipoprotein N-acyltransferase
MVGSLFLAVAGFHSAYALPACAFLMAGFLMGVVLLACGGSPRRAFYGALCVGLACYVPYLWFFHGIFRGMAVALWLVLALPLGLFALLVNVSWARFPRWASALAIPFLFMGLEYARCELYHLRFAWLTPGMAFGNSVLTGTLGSYGIGFLLAAFAAGLLVLRGRWRVAGVITGLISLAILARPMTTPPPAGGRELFVTGIQFEAASERELLDALDSAVSTYPQTGLFVLPEYAISSPPTQALTRWCARHQRYVLIGGTSPTKDGTNYYNTAFVIGPEGNIVFSQAKSVPIQFFRDGLPAPGQRVWESPWGKIGILICYDLSYTRVVDTLVQQGAEMLIVPTMDATSWGEAEHRLHGRIAPMRAAEHGVPIVRVASSGISQLVTWRGDVTAMASFPGQGEMVAGRIPLHAGRLPLDRYLAPVCVVIAGLVMTGLLISGVHSYMTRGRIHNAAEAKQAAT